MSRLLGGAEMLNKLVPHICAVVEHQEGYLGWEGTPEKGEAPVLHGAPEPKFPVLGRGVPTKCVCENQWRVQLSG